MKLSISTLGCPDWGFDRVVQAFEDLGVDIEVRSLWHRSVIEMKH